MDPQARPPERGHDPARPHMPVRYAPAAARAVIVLAVLTGAALVGPPAGAGLTAVLLALGYAVSATPARVPDLDLRVADESPRWTRVWWALAAALACVPALRAATWVVIPAVGTAALLVALAVSGRMLPLFTRAPLGALRTGRSAWEGGSVTGALPALRGAAIAAGLLAVFVPLLLSADAAFAQLAGNVLPSGRVDLPGARVLSALLVLAAGGALLDAGARRRPRVARGPRVRLGRIEWALPLAALTLLLAAFVATQLATLFGGDRHVLETAGLTYAEYAHSGFAQMMVVAGLTLAVVGAAARWARDGGRLLRALLAALSLLTLVVLASALRRLELYEAAYGFTRLRLTADAILLWLGALFCLVLLAGVAGGTWLPRAIVAVTGAAVLVFALSDPDRRIAERNLDNGRVDVGYLAGLGPDALPALTDRAPCAAWQIRERLGHDGLAGLNLARIRARHLAPRACLTRA